MLKPLCADTIVALIPKADGWLMVKGTETPHNKVASDTEML